VEVAGDAVVDWRQVVMVARPETEKRQRSTRSVKVVEARINGG
jgi:hypothetical protein